MNRLIKFLLLAFFLSSAVTACGVGGESGESEAPLLSNAGPQSLSAGPATAAFIDEVSILRAWGANESYQLCDGTDYPSDVPVVIDPPDKHMWMAVSVGGYHMIAIARNEQAEWSLWGWGYNGDGQLGLGGTTPDYVKQPAQTGKLQTGMDKGWKSVSAGEYHSTALKNDGKLYTWGYNDHCQLGYYTTPYYNPTLAQVGTENGWSYVSAGYQHTLAIRNTDLYAWGRNLEGQCGNGSEGADVCTPEYISSGWKQVSAGYLHSAGVKIGGTLWVWGEHDTAPVQIGTDDDWEMVDVGGGNNEHFLALKTDGSLWAWGAGGMGQLGNGIPPSIHYKEPLPIEIEPGTIWHDVSAGDSYSLSLWGTSIYNDLLYSWGSGALGLGNIYPAYVPTEVNMH